MTRFDRLPGTRDFYPDEMRVRRWIEDRWREVALRYGFEEYDAPVIEPLELFTDKSGEEIVEQIYSFVDRGDRRIALRPEMVAARSQGLSKPIKWFSIPRLFRYERPQRGRFREFWQLNLDILGVAGIEADAEIMAAGVDALRACGLTADDFELRYSDRRLLDAFLAELGIEPEPWVYAILDKTPRLGAEPTLESLIKGGIPADSAEQITATLAGSNVQQIDRSEFLAMLPNPREHQDRIEQLSFYLDAYGVDDFCRFDPRVVRGLAYYTGVVFEMYDRKGELRAICGGGRYDDLLESVGGQTLPAVGFGLGEAVLIELLEARDRLPTETSRCEVFVIPVSVDDRKAAIEVLTELRNAGVAGDLTLRDQSVAKALKRAAQAGARAAILIGERERESGSLTFRELDTGNEATLSVEQIVARLTYGTPA
jgi:histidyl-tRNA synthetase